MKGRGNNAGLGDAEASRRQRASAKCPPSDRLLVAVRRANLWIATVTSRNRGGFSCEMASATTLQRRGGLSHRAGALDGHQGRLHLDQDLHVLSDSATLLWRQLAAAKRVSVRWGLGLGGEQEGCG